MLQVNNGGLHSLSLSLYPEVTARDACCAKDMNPINYFEVAS